MKISLNIETLKNPKLVLEAKKLVITNKGSKYFFYLVIFHVLILIFAYFQPDRVEKIPFTIIVVCLLFYWFYKSITIDTTIFDTDEKSIYFKTSNPIKRIFWTILKYRPRVSYGNISKVYIEERAIIKNTFRKNFVILETDDPYKLVIATFDNRADAEVLVKDLKLEIIKK